MVETQVVCRMASISSACHDIAMMKCNHALCNLLVRYQSLWQNMFQHLLGVS